MRWMILSLVLFMAACTHSSSSDHGGAGGVGGSAVVDNAQFDSSWLECADRGAHPQFQLVAWQINSKDGYALRVTDASGNMRRYVIVGNLVQQSDGDGQYEMATFQGGGETLDVKSYEATLFYISVNHGPRFEMVCPFAKDVAHQQAEDIMDLQGRWCRQVGNQTLAYTYKLDWNDEKNWQVTEETFNGDPSTTPVSSLSGKWTLQNGQLTMSFTDGSTQFVPALWAGYGGPQHNTRQWAFEFPDHRDVYVGCSGQL